jgi:hypothetical protein
MTHTRYQYVVIEEEEYITDLSVSPLDSILFYCITKWNGIQYRGKIMKASQDGENKTVLTRQNIKYPSALTIDLVLRKVIWIDAYSKTFSTIDFDGNNFITFGTHNNDITNPFTQVFGDNIY